MLADFLIGTHRINGNLLAIVQVGEATPTIGAALAVAHDEAAGAEPCPFRCRPFGIDLHDSATVRSGAERYRVELGRISPTCFSVAIRHLPTREPELSCCLAIP